MTVYEATTELCEILKRSYAKNTGSENVHFVFHPGKKYHKIVMCTKISNDPVQGYGFTTHAFVDKETGDLYKAASWAAPAKGIRFNLLKDMELLRNRADWCGGYLYR
jgi:hypothetical protein